MTGLIEYVCFKPSFVNVTVFFSIVYNIKTKINQKLIKMSLSENRRSSFIYVWVLTVFHLRTIEITVFKIVSYFITFPVCYWFYYDKILFFPEHGLWHQRYLCTMLGMITTWRAGCAVHILLPHPPCLLHARLLHRINETLYRGEGAEGDAGGVWASGPQYSGEVRAEHVVHRRLSEYSVFDQHYSVDSVSVSRYKNNSK